MAMSRENSLTLKTSTAHMSPSYGRNARRDTYSRRTVSDQGPQQHLWAHQWWNRRGQKRTSAPATTSSSSSSSSTSAYPKIAVLLRARRSWPVEPRYKRRYVFIILDFQTVNMNSYKIY